MPRSEYPPKLSARADGLDDLHYRSAGPESLNESYLNCFLNASVFGELKQFAAAGLRQLVTVCPGGLL